MPYGYGVIGDSIADGARRPLRRQLGADGRVFAHPGETIREQLDALRRFVATSAPDAPAYVNLGTNDVFRGNRGAQAIRDALQILGDRQVNWVNVRSHGVNPFYGRDWQQRAQQFNQLLSQIAGNHSNVNVVDWDGYSRGHRNWFGADGLHPNLGGSRAYAQFLAQQGGSAGITANAESQAAPFDYDLPTYASVVPGPLKQGGYPSRRKTDFDDTSGRGFGTDELGQLVHRLRVTLGSKRKYK